MPTTISLDAKVRDRLKTFGTHGMTYNDILTRMMDEIERDAFVAEMRRIAAETKEEGWVDLEDIDWDESPKVPSGKRRRAPRAPARAKARRA
jgi:hypothetical protein